ncbi:MAG: GTP pyrophosphokinase family protein [Lachnospiraceae bacterium]|nr:GTP pyrophosphokinase family protein [Lachnospiraceae bacterium]MDE6626638.1 GTP pyrophosphokinase family protein [Lachnospiraceae bacterium]
MSEYEKIALPSLREKTNDLPALTNDIMEQLKVAMQQSQQFQEMMMMYKCAIREVQTKAEVLNDEMSVRYHRNPISRVSSRVKKPESIAQKLYRKSLPFTVEAVMSNLSDVAGVRIICEFIDDIYTIATMLVMQDDLKVIKVKDYIKYPKPNGYRSYHLIVEIPVFFSKGKTPMRVEIQIRTIAMDFWASLDHELKYKKGIAKEEEEKIAEELLFCADRIAETDKIMQQIRMKMDSVAELHVQTGTDEKNKKTEIIEGEYEA